MNRIARIARLVAIEWIKIRGQILFFVAIALILAASITGSWFQELSARRTIDVKKGSMAEVHAIQVFSNGAKHGLKMAALFMVIFGALMFSTEFDRGTIKNILTRPVTRTDVYIAKGISALLLAAFMAAVALYASMLYGAWKGQMGEVWDDSPNTFYKFMSYPDLAAHAWDAVLMCLPALAAAMVFGLFMSAIFDSTGVAVAFALIMFLAADLAISFLGEDTRCYLFNFYPDHVLEILKRRAGGSTDARWSTQVASLWLAVPAATIGGFTILSYLRFRWRDVTG